MSVLISDLVPHADLPSDDIDSVYPGLEVVHESPVLVVEISEEAIVFPETFVEVGQVVVGQNNFIFSALELAHVLRDAPPLNHIVLLQRKVDLFVCPVYHLLVLGYLISPQFLLPPPVVNRQVEVAADIVLLHVLFYARTLVPALVGDLIASKVEVIVRKF